MSHLKLLLDTNVIIDFLDERDPYYEKARLLMIAGRLGEFDLWTTSSQFTDLVYVLSDGGKRNAMPHVLERLRGLRTFVNVYPVSDREIDQMLSTSWSDPEDALLANIALRMKADCLITRNQKDFGESLVKIFDCDELFAWLKSAHSLVYQETQL